MILRLGSPRVLGSFLNTRPNDNLSAEKIGSVFMLRFALNLRWLSIIIDSPVWQEIMEARGQRHVLGRQEMGHGGIGVPDRRSLFCNPGRSAYSDGYPLQNQKLQQRPI